MGGDDGAAAERKALEHRLLRMAREYERQQEEKQVTQATCIGHPLMSADEIQALEEQEEKRKADENRQQREADRSRASTEKQDARVVVDVHKHPMNAPEVQRVTFSTSAADRVAARKELLQTFVSMARAILVTQRVRNRIAKARASFKGENLTGHQALDAAPALNFISLPVMSMSSAQRAPPIDCTASIDGGKTTSVDSFEPLELKVPFHFKLMGYQPHPLPEHPFVSADPPTQLQMFPFGDNEPMEEEQEALPKSLVVEPLPENAVSFSHEWPTQDFTFPKYVRTDLFPYHLKQPETSLGFPTPYIPCDFGAEHLPPTTAWKTMSNAVLHDPLPEPIMKARAEDALSDDDDEDATDVTLDVPVPQSLHDVLSVFGGLNDCFLINGLDSDDAAVLLPPKPIHRFDSDVKNSRLRIDEVEQVLSSIEACLPPHLRKQF